MSQSEILEWAKVIGPIICSWPTVALLAFIILRKPVLNFVKQISGPDIRKAKIGPVEIERQLNELAEKGKEAVNTVNRLNELMAESRLFELEIFEGQFSRILSSEQHENLRQQIEEFRKLTQQHTQEEAIEYPEGREKGRSFE